MFFVLIFRDCRTTRLVRCWPMTGAGPLWRRLARLSRPECPSYWKVRVIVVTNLMGGSNVVVLCDWPMCPIPWFLPISLCSFVHRLVAGALLRMLAALSRLPSGASRVWSALSSYSICTFNETGRLVGLVVSAFRHSFILTCFMYLNAPLIVHCPLMLWDHISHSFVDVHLRMTIRVSASYL